MNEQFQAAFLQQTLQEMGSSKPTGDSMKIWLAIFLGAKTTAEIRATTGLDPKRIKLIGQMISHGLVRKEQDGYVVNNNTERLAWVEAQRKRLDEEKAQFAAWREQQKVAEGRRNELATIISTFAESLGSETEQKVNGAGA